MASSANIHLNGGLIFKYIHYASSVFGTWITIGQPNPHKARTYAVSLAWCLVIVANQVDYTMKTWNQDPIENAERDVAIEKIVRLDFWTFNAISFVSCLMPVVNRKTISIQLNTNCESPKGSAWRTFKFVIVIVILLLGNLTPPLLGFLRFLNTNRANHKISYNMLFQEICKLGTLTVDLQFSWFCYSLRNGFECLNDSLIAISDKSLRNFAWGKETLPKKNVEGKIHQAHLCYRTLTETAKTVNGLYEERILVNMLCYMFHTVCGLFNALSLYKRPNGSRLLVIILMLSVIHCISRITLVCYAASAVVKQDERVHDLALAAEEALVTKHSDTNLEMKRFLRRLAYTKVKFDVCGMMTVDKSLLSTALVGVISYLVLVLQYNYT